MALTKVIGAGLGKVASSDLDGAVTINESSADVDFRVESNGNANMLFVDGGNDRVGIGTSSPQSKLDIITSSTGGLNIEDGTVKHSLSGANITAYQGSSNTNVRTLGIDAQQFIVRTGVPQGTSTSERMRIDSSGNVGIGITPTNTFHVGASGTVTSRYTSTDTGAFSLLRFENTGSIVLSADHGNTQSNSNIVFQRDGATESMRITSTGNVGIGIVPQSFSKLQIKTATDRNVAIFDNATGVTIGGLTDAGASTTLRLAGSALVMTGGGGSGSEHMRIDSSGNLLVGGTSAYGTTTFTASSGGDIKASATGRAAIFNASTSSYSGSLVDFRVEDSAIGTIGTDSQHSKIAMFDSSGGFILGTTGLLPSTSEGRYYGGQRDLGTPSVNWKDLYLSGKAQADTYQFAQNSSATGVTEALYRPTTGAMAFKTNSSERMRIDSSGNLLVGKTSADTTAVGIEARSVGLLVATRTSGQPIYANLRGDDGDVIGIAKDDVKIGSIGTNGTRLHIASTGNSGLRFRDDLNAIIPCNADGTNSDGDQNLGVATVRFKTLFLSQGVRLGGTGTANELDDYEEGAWTPTITSGSSVFTYTNQVGVYTKIGRLVYATFDISYSSFTSPNGSNTYILLPAINASSSAVYHMAQLRGSRCTALTTAVTAYDGSHAIIPGSNYFEINKNDGAGNSGVVSSNNGLNSSGRIVGTAIYSTS